MPVITRRKPCPTCSGNTPRIALQSAETPAKVEKIMQFQFSETPFEGRIEWHYIMLGRAPKTEENLLLQRNRDLHPGDTFVVWDEARVEQHRAALNLPREYDEWLTRTDQIGGRDWTDAARRAAQSDILRVAILAMAGEPDVFRIYCDYDTVWHRNVRQAIGGVSAFVAQRLDEGTKELCNAILGAQPGHPFYVEAMRVLPGVQMWNYRQPFWNQVGSPILYKLLQIGDWGVTVFPSHVFFPYTMAARTKNEVMDFAGYLQNSQHLATHLFGGSYMGRTLPPLQLPEIAPESAEA